MTSEDQASEPGVGDSVALPWWDVRRSGVLQLYIGLCWAFTPLALTYLRERIGQSIGIGFIGIGLVWVVGHVALIYCVFRLRLIQRAGSKLLFVAAVVTASVGAGGTAVLVIVPEALSMRDFKLVAALPPLLTAALGLLSLSVRRSGPHSSLPHT